MIITLDLTDAEVDALNTEKVSGESVEQVVRRLIVPLVARSTKARFSNLLIRFQAATPERQAQVVSVLEKLNF